jgi:hypothetical protein
VIDSLKKAATGSCETFGDCLQNSHGIASQNIVIKRIIIYLTTPSAFCYYIAGI